MSRLLTSADGTTATLLVVAILCLSTFFPPAALSAPPPHQSLHRGSHSITTSSSPALTSPFGQGTGTRIGPGVSSNPQATNLAVAWQIDLDHRTLSTAASASPPVIQSFTPSAGEVLSGVTVTGYRFTGATDVTFNGEPAEFSVLRDSAISAKVPLAATTGPISVTTAAGTATSSFKFTVIPPPPLITGFTPMSGPVGTSVTVTGFNFKGVRAVTFNNRAAASFEAVSETSIKATIPSGATSGPIAVTTPDGKATSATSFTVTPSSPTITGFSPTFGPAGTVVTVAGTNFTGATMVTFGGSAAAGFTVVSATQLTATVPGGATSGQVVVTTPGGKATSATSFTVTPPPTVHGFSPSSGKVGTAVTLSGKGFLGASQVAFGSVTASFTIVSDEQITTSVPSGAGSAPVSVTTRAGTAYSPWSFTVTKPGESVKDRGRPTIKAMNAVGTREGQRTVIRYRVNDPRPSCGKATVHIVIKRKDGSEAWSASIYSIATNRDLSYSFKCPIGSGLYRYYLSCRDAAGNDGKNVSSRGFRVY